jgi:hypothetical protein
MSFSLAGLSDVAGVAHSPNSVSSVRGTDGASWNNKRPAGVTLSFQVRKHVVEAHADVPSNVLSNDPSGPEFSHDPTKFWPEMAVIFRASASPGCGERLAWVSPHNDICMSNIRTSQFPHVFIDRHLRPMLPQHLAGEFFDFAKGDGLKPARALKAKAEPAYTAEQVENAQHHENTAMNRPKPTSAQSIPPPTAPITSAVMRERSSRISSGGMTHSSYSAISGRGGRRFISKRPHWQRQGWSLPPDDAEFRALGWFRNYQANA